MDDALQDTTRAITVAINGECPRVLIAELRHTRADLLRQVGRYQDAMEEFNAVSTVAMPSALRSRLLHLKALLLGLQSDIDDHRIRKSEHRFLEARMDLFLCAYLLA